MVNPTAWNWKKLTAFFWVGLLPPSPHHPWLTCTQGGICFLCIVYTYLRIPEPAGRSFAEIDYLFEHGVSARKFADAEVDVFATEESERAEKMFEKEKSEDGKVERV
jgi:SP family general alpha glucoside:H+ symporter-like MFS transporter